MKICSVYILLFSSVLVNAQFEHQTKLQPSDLINLDAFGSSVSIWENTAIVGISGDDEGASGTGSAYVYHFNGTTWTFIQNLTSFDAASQDMFGNSVAIYGNTIAIAAKNDDDMGINSGSVYIYELTDTTWQYVQKLTANDGATSDNFGNAISLNGSYLAVAASMANGDSADEGAVYIFRKDITWVQEKKIKASDATYNDRFGSSVNIHDPYIIVGTPMNDDHGSASGSAYIFKRTGTGWNEVALLSPDDGTASDNFGFSVAISNDFAVTGTYKDDDLATDCGSAYIYINNAGTWTYQTKLLPEGNVSYNWFGISVAIDSNTIAVGAPYGNSMKGTVYVYQYNVSAWEKIETLADSAGQSQDNFGGNIDIYGDRIIVSAAADDHDVSGESDAGSAHIFESCSEQYNIEDSICSGDTVSFGGQELTVQGVYYDTLQNTEGCDSIIILNLTVLNKPLTPVITQSGDTLFSSNNSGNQWYDENGEIPSATDSFYVVSSSGNYYVIITENGCISDTSEIMQVNITKVGNIYNKYVSIYPNPVNNISILDLSVLNETDLIVSIYNSLGQEIFKTSDLKNNKLIIDKKQYPTGMYIYKILNKSRNICSGMFIVN